MRKTEAKIESAKNIPAKSNTKIEVTPEPAGGDFGRIKASINEAKLCLNTLV